jgi:catechol 2,3-dioxygenase-like lactoylglutathione lyase family enzyme
MDVTHLHLHVRDREHSEAFYTRWLGLKTQWRTDEMTFMAGDRDFLLALMQDGAPQAMPAWFHFGARLQSRDEVRALLERMQAAGVPIVKPLYEGPTLMSFQCADPDGHRIELYAA